MTSDIVHRFTVACHGLTCDMNYQCMRVAFFKTPSVPLRLSVQRCQTVLLRMVLEWSFEIVPSDEEPAQSYAPPSTSAFAFASPDGFLLVFFSSVAAERRALIMTTKQAYTYASFAFLSMLEKQTAQERRRVKPHLQQLWAIQGLATWQNWATCSDGFTF